MSADKMMIRARGPVWHQKHKSKGVVPKNLRGLDKEATWSTSKSDGWVYGHGSFCIVPHEAPVAGVFMWMPNSAHEAKRMERELSFFDGALDCAVMDSKADDQKLFHRLKQERGIQLVTVCRKKMNKTPGRRAMIEAMRTKRCRRLLKERGHKVEPMQGLIKEIFDLDRCWMRGDANNRWLFAAMGIAVQMHQLKAWREGRSTWKIKSEVLGEP